MKPVPEHSRFVTAEMRRNAGQNAEKFAWARKQRKRAELQAAPWLAMSDEALWNLVPSQGLPRCIHTNILVGCPNCGDKIVPFGNYPWEGSALKNPWKLTCPACGESYPKNDFEAFYKSGLDEHGFFDRERGNQSLLFNSEHPDPADPLHKVFVDDGYGMKDLQGKRHTVIPYYTHWVLWRKTVLQSLTHLANAYTMTDDSRYAHKAAILLDRLADVYPDMDLTVSTREKMLNSHGGSGRGGILGCIWETGTAVNIATCYDHIYDGIRTDGELAAFCAKQSTEYSLSPRNSIAEFDAHIQNNLIGAFFRNLLDERIRGNTGHHQRTCAVAAIAYHQPEMTEKWLDWLFDPQFPSPQARKHDPIQWVLTEGLDRDGMGGECGGYGLIWVRSMVEIAGLLASYPEYRKHDMLRDFPKFRKAFLVPAKLHCLDAVLPPIGDTSKAGAWGRIARPGSFMQGYEWFKDPQMASLAWKYADRKVSALRRKDDIFRADPDQLINEIKRLGEKATDEAFPAIHLGRYGFATLQSGNETATGTALWMHYGGPKGHSHSDSLNLGLYAWNIDMLPDLGYPEYTGAWPKRVGWTSHTVSHNTLLVDDRRSANRGGQILLFKKSGTMQLLEVEAPDSYPNTESYRRTSAMIECAEGNRYVIDLFHARGGNVHRLSWHGPGENTTVEGLELVKQGTGTFAGPNVPYGEFYDGKVGWRYKGAGFMYLDKPSRSGATKTPYTVDWPVEMRRERVRAGTVPHLRLHALTDCDEVALASGSPPQNKSGAPKWLRYLIQTRKGDALESNFVNVLEPYNNTPFLRSVRHLEVEAAEGVIATVLRIEHEDGTTDFFLHANQRTQLNVEGIELEGQVGFVRLRDGKVTDLQMLNGTRLSHSGHAIETEQPAFEGVVKAVDISDPLDSRILLDPPIPQNSAVVGECIHFLNDNPLDTTYDIVRLLPDAVSTGDTTIIQGHKDFREPRKGYRLLVNPGDRYIVPIAVGWTSDVTK